MSCRWRRGRDLRRCRFVQLQRYPMLRPPNAIVAACVAGLNKLKSEFERLLPPGPLQHRVRMAQHLQLFHHNRVPIFNFVSVNTSRSCADMAPGL